MSSKYNRADNRKPNISYSQCRANLPSFEDPNVVITDSVSTTPPDYLRSLMSQNAGKIKIEWTDGSPDWYEFGKPKTGIYPYEEYFGAQNPLDYYLAFWTPDTPQQDWPKALKFTFTLYDSKAIMKDGRDFTHMVYLDD